MDIKKIMEDAMLDAENIQNAVNNNSKNLIRSVMKEEIEEVVKQKLNEAEYDEEDVEIDKEDTEDTEEEPETDAVDDADGKDKEDTEDSEDIELPDETPDSEEISAEEEPESTDLPMADNGMESGSDEDLENIDVTGMSDNELISVFKKLKDDDDLEVVSDKEVKIKDSDSGNEYIVKTGGEESNEEIPDMNDMGTETEPEMNTETEPDMEEEGMLGENVIYEIVLTEEEEGGHAKHVTDTTAQNGKIEDAKTETKAPGSEKPGNSGANGGHAKHVANTTAQDGEIDDAKAEENSKLFGDNLKGGEPMKTPGKQGGHAQEVKKSTSAQSGKIEDVKPNVVKAAGGEPMETPGKKGNHAQHVMESVADDRKKLKTLDPESEEYKKLEKEIKFHEKAEKKASELGDKDPLKTYKSTGLEDDNLDETKAHTLKNMRDLSKKDSADNFQKAHTRPGVKTEMVKRVNSLIAEHKNQKTQINQFRDVLKQMKTALSEQMIYNANLTHFVKLVMENATTKEEKESFLKRFDEQVTSVDESKKLYKAINEELKGKKPLKESLLEKATKTPLSAASTSLKEKNVYVDNSILRIKNLMNDVDNFGKQE